MLYVTQAIITVSQVGEGRDKIFTIPFVTEYEIESSWDMLTSTMKLKLPKKCRVKQDTGEWLYLSNDSGYNSNIGGFTEAKPLFMRGDMIYFSVGYLSRVDGKEHLIMTEPYLFQGFISRVAPGMTYEIECEDAMWLLKQIPTPIGQKQWEGMTVNQIVQKIYNDAKSNKLSKLYQYVQKGVNFTIQNTNEGTVTEVIFNVENMWTQGESLAEFLGRLKRQYKLNSYFRGTDLRLGMPAYISGDYVEHTLDFQQNIIEAY